MFRKQVASAIARFALSSPYGDGTKISIPPFTIWSGIISISYFFKTSCDKSHVLSDIIFTILTPPGFQKSFCPSFLFYYTILFYYFNCGINILFSCPYSIVTFSFYYSIKKRYFHQGGGSNVHFTVGWLSWLCAIAL